MNARHDVLAAFVGALSRLDRSLSPRDTIRRLRRHTLSPPDAVYVFHILNASFWLFIIPAHALPLKLFLPALYLSLIVIPLTSQFFLPATPILAWVLTYFTSRFIPSHYRPSISVSLLPTLESVLYGANISDILTRFTHPALDIIAWLPYGVFHFTFPFVVAAFLWLFRTKHALHLWARTFGYMNLVGVFTQIIFPCAPPWYELIYGLTPADYTIRGSPGGLARIDALFHSSGYTTTFSNSPVVFGAFPSLHAACGTLEALFISHFFPQSTRWAWAYAGILYWATMYLSHHYLIDVVGGACLAVAFFYWFLPEDLCGPAATALPTGLAAHRSKYEAYDLEVPRSRRPYHANGSANIMHDAIADFDTSETSSRASDEEDPESIPYRSPLPSEHPKGKGKNNGKQPRRGHRHTASIASLVRADEVTEDGWSPIRTNGFT